ncbi:hypothetical protein ABPG74_022385 [Tetrahymena malaccensis]
MSDPQPSDSLRAPEVQTARHNDHKDYQPVTAYCSNCKKEENAPVLSFKTGTGTYLCCFIWCCVAVLPGLIPFCCNRCKDKVYTCPECGLVIRKDTYEPCNCNK